jgi:Kef-type K+ transport system membrane component KefB
MIVGAFTAGLLLASTDKKEDIVGELKPVSDLFVPVFFVMVGSRVELGAFNPFGPAGRALLALAFLLVAAAVAGKVAAGWAAFGGGLNRASIGVGMVPRGEVGLIFAQIGLGSGAIGAPLYAAVVGMVVFTTFLTPPLLKRVFAGRP